MTTGFELSALSSSSDDRTHHQHLILQMYTFTTIGAVAVSQTPFEEEPSNNRGEFGIRNSTDLQIIVRQPRCSSAALNSYKKAPVYVYRKISGAFSKEKKKYCF